MTTPAASDLHRRAPRRGVHRAAALLLLAVAAGCQWGTRPSNFEPARGPAGAMVTLRVRGERGERRGELFAADSVGITIRAPRLVRIAWARLDWADVAGLGGDYDVRLGEPADAEKRARLALVSRFPQGLSDALLARVVAALSQPAREEVR